MVKFVLRRLLGGLLTLLAASFLVFGALYVVPGDPVATLLKGKTVTPELVEALREQYHLNEPFLTRYWIWLSGAIRGDFGESIQFRQDVSSVIASRVPTTVTLVVMAAVIIVVLGLLSGIVAALRPGFWDRSILNFTAIAAATPLFVTALLAIVFFSTILRWFPAYGTGDGSFIDRVYHLMLPSLVLAFGYLGLVARMTRSTLRLELASEHYQVARSRGITGAVLFRRHALRNSLPPIMTLSAVVVPGLIVSSSIVEVSFGISGIGSLLIQAVTNVDFAIVQAITMIIVCAFVVANLLIDIILPLIDPRIAAEGRAS